MGLTLEQSRQSQQSRMQTVHFLPALCRLRTQLEMERKLKCTVDNLDHVIIESHHWLGWFLCRQQVGSLCDVDVHWE